MKRIQSIINAVIIMNLCSENIIESAKKGATVSNVVERSENITKFPEDRRSYRSLRLSNEMKILLISDPDAEKAAASMLVGVGSLCDFREVPGIANLVACMLMAGSKQHSKRLYNFETFINARGGQLEFSSGQADQIFGFNVTAKRLSDALKRFSEFFDQPFISYANDGVMEAVLDVAVEVQRRQCEENANLDHYRINEVERSISKKNHPYNHFSIGNKETLFEHTKDIEENESLKIVPDPKKKSLVSKAKKFHSMWYSSNIMNLVVLGLESLDNLEAMVVPLFEGVQNKNVKKITYPYKHHPWGAEQTKNKIYVVPLAEGPSYLRLNFPIAEVRDQYGTAPDLYLGHLITYEGPGSLLSLLRKRNLCTRIDVENKLMAGIGFYHIKCILTEDGVERVDEAINLIFQYIHFVNSDGVQEGIFEELRAIQQLIFQQYEPDDLSLGTLANAMQHYPIEEILAHLYSLKEWKPLCIKEFLSHFEPDKVNVTIVSKSFEKIAKQTEKYLGAKYTIERIDDETIQRWKTVEGIYDFQFPSMNEFIPRNLELYPPTKDEPKDPYIIHQSSISEIWFKQDDAVTVPRLTVVFDLLSNLAWHSPPESALRHLFYNLLVPYLTEYLSSATALGFQLIVVPDEYGLQVVLCGFHETLPVLLEKLLSKITRFGDGILEEHFNDVLQKFISTFINELEGNHSFQGESYTRHSQTQGSWSVHNNLEAAKTLHYSDMKKYVKNAFRRIFIRCLIHGNYIKQKAMDIVSILEKPFRSSRGLLLQEMLPPRITELPEGSHFISRLFNNKNDVYGYNIYFQFGTVVPYIHYGVLNSLLQDVIEQTCYSILPDQDEEQSPSVMCNLLNTFGVRGLAILIESKKEPRVIDLKVEKFLRDLPKQLKNLPTNEFNNWKENLEAREYTEPENFDDFFKRYWIEIRYRNYRFDRVEKELEELRSLKKSDFLRFFDEMLHPSSTRRRRLSMYIFPENTKGNQSALISNTPNGATILKDLIALQMTLASFPVNFNM